MIKAVKKVLFRIAIKKEELMKFFKPNKTLKSNMVVILNGK